GRPLRGPADAHCREEGGDPQGGTRYQGTSEGRPASSHRRRMEASRREGGKPRSAAQRRGVQEALERRDRGVGAVEREGRSPDEAGGGKECKAGRRLAGNPAEESADEFRGLHLF